MVEKVAIVGGTFDPIHRGHIEPVLELAKHFNWQQIRVMPTFTPPYREQPIASDQQRFAMVSLVCKRDARLIADDFELKRATPSRTVPTLKALTERYSESEIYFVIGMDSLVNLNTWQDWQALTDYAHIVVLPRPQYSYEVVPEEVRTWINKQHSPYRVFVTSTNTYSVSSTEIRQACMEKKNESLLANYLYPEVLEYIRTHKLYGFLPK